MNAKESLNLFLKYCINFKKHFVFSISPMIPLGQGEGLPPLKYKTPVRKFILRVEAG